MSIELRTLIREVAAEHPKAAPDEIARHVAKLTPDDDLQNFYAETLTQVVIAILGQDRRTAMDGPEVRSGSRSQPNPSPKLRDRRQWWTELLASRVAVGKGEWKIMADCTFDDLQVCIEERLKQIVGFNEQIDNFKYLQELMTRYGVGTVGALPPQQNWRVA